MAQVTIQQILQRGYAGCEEHHLLPAYVRKAVWALLACRTARLGGHIQACPEGHVERVWYNSCRHRLCPQCAWLQVERWLGRQRVRLLACDHYHRDRKCQVGFTSERLSGNLPALSYICQAAFLR
jgi:hypothetical protein